MGRKKIRLMVKCLVVRLVGVCSLYSFWMRNETPYSVFSVSKIGSVFKTKESDENTTKSSTVGSNFLLDLH